MVFDSEEDGGSYVMQKSTGRKTKLNDEEGGYTFEMRISKAVLPQGFQRQVSGVSSSSNSNSEPNPTQEEY